jgi:hypothetical protein
MQDHRKIRKVNDLCVFIIIIIINIIIIKKAIVDE